MLGTDLSPKLFYLESHKLVYCLNKLNLKKGNENKITS